MFDFAQESGLYIGAMAQYTEPHRKFHNLKHLQFMLETQRSFTEKVRKELQGLQDWGQVLYIDEDLLTYAIIFHDWFYDPSRNDNEERSGDYAYEWVKRVYLSDKTAAYVKEMIIATASHGHVDVREDPEKALLLDLDMAGLGTPAEDYVRTTGYIAQEYFPVYGRQFIGGRTQWIREMLVRPSLYNYQCFKEAFEVQAKTNLIDELSYLKSIEHDPSINTYSRYGLHM
jgi:predicted metal-dependent HD superfamily phosphohydrolase